MSVQRLVIASNRLPSLKRDRAGRVSIAPEAGGLVTALLSALSSAGESLWMGWSGKGVVRGKAVGSREIDTPVARFLAVDLTESEVDDYYNGFCNRTLWPMFHCFQGRIRVDHLEQRVYFKVNERFGRTLAAQLRPGDAVWVQDYHMVPLGQVLRRHGFAGPLGFFLHIPFPPLEMIEILPDPHRFLGSMLAYDLVGFHTDRYTENYFETVERLGLAQRRDDTLISDGHRQRVMTSPIGISPEAFDPGAGDVRGGPRKRLPPRPSDCRVVLGVDRLDYTKGIPERIIAMETLLKRFPRWRRKVCLVQICAPSRTRVREYIEQKRRMEQVVGRVNSELGLPDWEPIHYLNRSYSHKDLAGFYRDSDVMLVTPLRDGMNLVAMEYVAAQDPTRPGALVLSRYAGVADYLGGAVDVNPYLPLSVALGVHQALTMPRSERRRRHGQMMDFIRSNPASGWANGFVRELCGSGPEVRPVGGALMGFTSPAAGPGGAAS